MGWQSWGGCKLPAPGEEKEGQYCTRSTLDVGAVHGSNLWEEVWVLSSCARTMAKANTLDQAEHRV